MLRRDDGLEACYREACVLRERLHSWPELGHQELQTSELIRTTLQSYGVQVLDYGLKTGVVGRIVGGHPGKLLALREDIDALPIQENTGLPFASQTTGVSHACGHDIHTAALLGCAGLLAQRGDALHGSVLFIFQCAEETFDGAATMLERDIFRDGVPDALLGFHCSPDLPLGTLGILRGTANASCDVITLRVQGKGGHGAHPDKSIDPIVIGAGLLTQLQTIVSRNNKATEPVVLTFGEFHSGSAPNIIPNEAVIRGTLRTFRNEVRLRHLDTLERICRSFCAAFGAEGHVYIEKGMPPLINDKCICRQLAASAETVLGDGCVVTKLTPSMGSDDFSCLLESCGGRGAQYLLGTALPDIPSSSLGLHVGETIFPSEAIRPGIASLAQFAMDYLGQ